MDGNQLDFRVAKVPNRERLEQDTLSSCRAGCGAQPHLIFEYFEDIEPSHFPKRKLAELLVNM